MMYLAASVFHHLQGNLSSSSPANKIDSGMPKAPQVHLTICRGDMCLHPHRAAGSVSINYALIQKRWAALIRRHQADRTSVGQKRQQLDLPAGCNQVRSCTNEAQKLNAILLRHSRMSGSIRKKEFPHTPRTDEDEGTISLNSAQNNDVSGRVLCGLRSEVV